MTKLDAKPRHDQQNSLHLLLQSSRSRDNFRELCCDGRLSRSVVGQGQLAEHLLGILGGGLHGRHAGCLLAAVVLEHAVEEHHSELKLREVLQKLSTVRALELIAVQSAAQRHLLLQCVRGQHSGDGGLVGDGGLEAVVDHARHVKLRLHQLLSHPRCLREGHLDLTDLLNGCHDAFPPVTHQLCATLLANHHQSARLPVVSARGV
mmetsp:Transcript_13823/g.41773  ORF Transcript_13823/g.41773 Transcript_13823/m.41773 type:complete len:206 (+) Transcript_13823:64-681(+)